MCRAVVSRLEAYEDRAVRIQAATAVRAQQWPPQGSVMPAADDDDVYAVAAAPDVALDFWNAEMTSLPNFSIEPITFSCGMVSVCIISIT